jgi:hypothetical protein
MKYKCYTFIANINVQKTYKFKLSVKDDNFYDACKSAYIKIEGLGVSPSGL